MSYLEDKISPETHPEQYFPFQATQAEIDDQYTSTYSADSFKWVPHQDVTDLESYTQGKHLSSMARLIVNNVEKVGRLDIGLYPGDSTKLKIYFLSSQYYNKASNTWIDPKNNAVHVVDISAMAGARIDGVNRIRKVDFGLLQSFHKNETGSIHSALIERAWMSIPSCFGIRIEWSRNLKNIIWYLDVPGHKVGINVSFEVYSEDYFKQPSPDPLVDDLVDSMFIDDITPVEDTSGPRRIVTYEMTAQTAKLCDPSDKRDWITRFKKRGRIGFKIKWEYIIVIRQHTGW